MKAITNEYIQVNKFHLYNYSAQENYDYVSIFDLNFDFFREGFNVKEIQRCLLETLGASVWQSYSNTFEYRWRGEDTLTWGNLGSWLQVEWIRKNFRNIRLEPFLDKHNILKEIINITSSYKLEELYEFRNEEKIVHYLWKHPDLINFLDKSYHYLLENFESSSKFALEIVNDPEAKKEHLIVYINTSMTVDDALDSLDRFDNEWFLDKINWVGHLINFNLEIK